MFNNTDQQAALAASLVRTDSQQQLEEALAVSRHQQEYAEAALEHDTEFKNAMEASLQPAQPAHDEDERAFTWEFIPSADPKHFWQILLGPRGSHLHWLYTNELGHMQIRVPQRTDAPSTPVRITGAHDQVEIAYQRLREIDINRGEFQSRMRIAMSRLGRQHLFVDGSNIFIGSQQLEDGTRDLNCRLSIPAFSQLVSGSAWCACRHVFGSSPPHNSGIWQAYGKRKFEVTVEQRAQGYGEQGVDTRMVAHIERAILQSLQPQHKLYPPQSNTLVLCTGDGNDNDGEPSFWEAVNLALAQGWSVILWSWKCVLNNRYLSLQDQFLHSTGPWSQAGAGDFQVMLLDNHRDCITFSRSRLAASNTSAGAPGPSIDEDADEDYLTCPISLMTIQQPAYLPCLPGRHYEADALREWLANTPSCPSSRTSVAIENVQEGWSDGGATHARCARLGNSAQKGAGKGAHKGGGKGAHKGRGKGD